MFTAPGETNEALLIAYVLSGCRPLKALIISPAVEERSFLEIPAAPHAGRLTATHRLTEVLLLLLLLLSFSVVALFRVSVPKLSGSLCVFLRVFGVCCGVVVFLPERVFCVCNITFDPTPTGGAKDYSRC